MSEIMPYKTFAEYCRTCGRGKDERIHQGQALGHYFESSRSASEALLAVAHRTVLLENEIERCTMSDQPKRKSHSHLVCQEGPDPDYGHDHYCDLVEEPCDDEDCEG